MLQHTISKNSAAAGTAGPVERNQLQHNANTKSSPPFAVRRYPRKSAAAGAAELRPMETTKRKHQTSATVPHTISRNSAASAAELGPMKQRHTGNGNNEHQRRKEKEREEIGAGVRAASAVLELVEEVDMELSVYALLMASTLEKQ
ncbi:hypothetical protein ARMGADRAFT_1030471 [Armillaria gallica]|uniref:Uncharacterized protein n=1 Tax=Armillaria gallica TaxID=47427 RepID=A0A2H3DFW9_ARMGA|nr:hypothetical protein ARMGADRAFT_1030471 [Armillaria gallica]